MHTAWLTAAGLSQARRPTRTDGHSPIGLRCFQRCFLHASYSLDARYSSSLSTSMSNQSSFFSVLLASRLGWCSHTGRLMPDAFRLPQQQRINAYSQIVRRTQRTVTQTYSVQSCETYTATSRLHDRQACGQTDRQTEQSMNSASLSRCRDSNIDFSSAALLTYWRHAAYTLHWSASSPLVPAAAAAAACNVTWLEYDEMLRTVVRTELLQYTLTGIIFISQSLCC